MRREVRERLFAPRGATYDSPAPSQSDDVASTALSMQTIDRRSFLVLAASALATLTAAPLRALATPFRAAARRPDHPDPRPGIDARNVTPRNRLPPDVVATFDRVREIPGIVDGIACQCGCDEMADMRSLLSCFEGHGMAQHCIYCQGQADLAFEMTRAGRTLDEIRAAVEAEFG